MRRPSDELLNQLRATVSDAPRSVPDVLEQLECPEREAREAIQYLVHVGECRFDVSWCLVTVD